MFDQSTKEEIFQQLEELYITALQENNLTAALKSIELKMKWLVVDGKGKECFSIADLNDDDIKRLIKELE